MPYLSPLLTDRQLLAVAHRCQSELSALLRDRLSERVFALEMIAKHSADGLRVLDKDADTEAAMRQQIESARAVLREVAQYTNTGGF